MSEELERAKITARWDARGGIGSSHSPDERTVPALLAGILDALVAIAERLPEPGPRVTYYAPIPPTTAGEGERGEG